MSAQKEGQTVAHVNEAQKNRHRRMSIAEVG
jgi:hypothetical protein